jgi:hypothetical protein
MLLSFMLCLLDTLLLSVCFRFVVFVGVRCFILLSFSSWRKKADFYRLTVQLGNPDYPVITNDDPWMPAHLASRLEAEAATEPAPAQSKHSKSTPPSAIASSVSEDSEESEKEDADDKPSPSPANRKPKSVVTSRTLRSQSAKVATKAPRVSMFSIFDILLVRFYLLLFISSRRREFCMISVVHL